MKEDGLDKRQVQSMQDFQDYTDEAVVPRNGVV